MNNATYYQRNREVILNKAKDYYEINKEKLREQAKDYYENDKERLREQARDKCRYHNMSEEKKQRLKEY